MVITQELRNELLALLRQEMEQQEREKQDSKNMWQRVSREFEEDFAEFNYSKQSVCKKADGSRWLYTEQRPMAHQVKTALGTLLRAAYRADGAARLPADKEADVRGYIRAVLELTKGLREDRA